MSKVYVVTMPMRKNSAGELEERIPLYHLEEYGEVINLLEWNDHRRMNTDELIEKLSVRLEKFSKEDYIVPTGSPGIMAVAIAIASKHSEGKVKLLEWDSKRNFYRRININLDLL